MDKTENLGLNKPTYGESADIAALNENFDIIDVAITNINKGLVSDEEKAAWEAKETPAGAQAKADAAEAAAKVYTDTYVGDKNNLLTTDQSTIVAAVNELFTSVSDGKTLIAASITDKGIPADGSDTFAVLAGKIQDIPSGGQCEYGTAGPAQVLAGYTIGTENGLVEGTITSKAAQIYTPGTTNQVIAAGQYLSGPQTILGDPNLIPANIVSGKSIFGIAGNVQAGKNFATGTIAGSASSLSFLTPGETSINMIYVTVSGLTFLPSVIILVYTNEAYDHFKTAIYSKYGFGLSEGSTYYDTGKIIVTDKSGGYSDPSPWPKVFKLTGNAYVNGTGFRLPISTAILFSDATWYAWE